MKFREYFIRMIMEQIKEYLLLVPLWLASVLVVYFIHSKFHLTAYLWLTTGFALYYFWYYVVVTKWKNTNIEEEKTLSCPWCHSTDTKEVRTVSGVDQKNNDVDLVVHKCNCCQREFTDF